MLRALCLFLLGLVLLLEHPPVEAPGRLVEVSVSADGASAGDCCPDAPASEEEECDCCATDFGRCCAPAMLALVPSTALLHSLRAGIDEAPLRLAPPLHYPQTTGPPPTPPPIA